MLLFPQGTVTLWLNQPDGSGRCPCRLDLCSLGLRCAVWQLLGGAAVLFSRDPATNAPLEGNGHSVVLFWSCPGLTVIRVSHPSEAIFLANLQIALDPVSVGLKSSVMQFQQGINLSHHILSLLALSSSSSLPRTSLFYVLLLLITQRYDVVIYLHVWGTMSRIQ